MSSIKDDWEPENLSAKPAESNRRFFLFFLIGFVAGADIVYLIGRLLHG